MYDKDEKEFWFFNIGFNAWNRRIENEIGKFDIEVSLTNFEWLNRAGALSEARKNYPEEIIKRFYQEVTLTSKECL